MTDAEPDTCSQMYARTMDIVTTSRGSESDRGLRTQCKSVRTLNCIHHLQREHMTRGEVAYASLDTSKKSTNKHVSGGSHCFNEHT